MRDTSSTQRPARHEFAPRGTRTTRLGILLGIGLAGTLDEVVLHQLLHWHHFYDRSTSAVGLVSDGLFHIFSTTLLLVGMYRLWRDRSDATPGWTRRLEAGICLGAGGFNVYDGTIQHKLFKFHQVREGVGNLVPYDGAFIGIAVALLIVGTLLLRSARDSA